MRSSLLVLLLGAVLAGCSQAPPRKGLTFQPGGSLSLNVAGEMLKYPVAVVAPRKERDQHFISVESYDESSRLVAFMKLALPDETLERGGLTTFSSLGTPSKVSEGFVVTPSGERFDFSGGTWTSGGSGAAKFQGQVKVELGGQSVKGRLAVKTDRPRRPLKTFKLGLGWLGFSADPNYSRVDIKTKSASFRYERETASSWSDKLKALLEDGRATQLDEGLEALKEGTDYVLKLSQDDKNDELRLHTDEMWSLVVTLENGINRL